MTKKEIQQFDAEKRQLAYEMIEAILPIIKKAKHPAIATAAIKDAAFNTAVGIAVQMGADVREVMRNFSDMELISETQWHKWQQGADKHREIMERTMRDPDFIAKAMNVDNIKGKA